MLHRQLGGLTLSFGIKWLTLQVVALRVAHNVNET
jgi:hypothetical protein